MEVTPAVHFYSSVLMEIRHGVELKKLSNFKIGGSADNFLAASSASELAEGLKEWRRSERWWSRKGDIFILGGGTNILWSDRGFRGLVVKPEITVLERDGNLVRAGAGVSMDDLLRFAAEGELSGLEWAGGLPGTVGGAVFGNAGAFGGETKDSLREVLSVDLQTLATHRRSAEECEFSYRNSIFRRRRGEEVILEAVFELNPGDKADIYRGMEEKVRYREERQPLEHPNAGSIFKNVPADDFSPEIIERYRLNIKTDPFPVIPTARLISEAGLRGLSLGGAMVSPKHPNFIVNVLDATSADVTGLIGVVKASVRERFGVELEEEVLNLHR